MGLEGMVEIIRHKSVEECDLSRGMVAARAASRGLAEERWTAT